MSTEKFKKIFEGLDRAYGQYISGDTKNGKVGLALKAAIIYGAMLSKDSSFMHFISPAKPAAPDSPEIILGSSL